MQKQIKILLALLMALSLAVSCAKNNPNNPIEDSNTPPDNEWKTNPNFTKLKQKWQDNDISFGITQYIITDNKLENTYEGAVTYSFDIKYISWTSDTAGIIYGQYTANDDATVIGKWYAVSFKDLTDTTIKIAGAYKDGDKSAENLKEAISKFTEANGYFSSYSDCKVSTEVDLKTVQYGSKSAQVDINDQAKLKELWMGLVANQTVYSDAQYKWTSGEFKSDANYYETTWDSGNTARTEYIKNVTYTYNGKLYLAGIYWDNKTGVGMTARYRLIIIDENGVEQAWFGGESDETIIPDENSQWTKYNFVFGYLKTY